MSFEPRWGNLGWWGKGAAAACLAAACLGAPVHAEDGGKAAGDGAAVDLGQLSLKRLLDLDVTSVSKRSERLQDVASSIYVITSEDIRRSGATRLMDVLKMAPGAWFSEDSYTIGANAVREGASTFNLTLLWILDGVPVTNPVTGGLITDVLDLPLADIDRIEVIKGPGGTIYGANAASGIISIFTKGGEASDGLHASLELGTQGYAAPYFRYGFEPAENFFITAWVKYKSHDGYDRNPMFAGDTLLAPLKSGGSIPRPNRFPDAEDDNQDAVSIGGKWDLQPGSRWRLRGGLSQSHVRSGKYLISHHPWPDSNPNPQVRYDHPTASQLPREDRRLQVIAQTRLDYELREGHSFFVNADHWHHAHRWMAGPGYNNDFYITDLEVQDNLELGRHRFSLGANLRRVQYDFTDLYGNRSNLFHEGDRTAFLFGSFLQDEMALGRKWRLTMGAKAETWTLIGWEPEISPSVRLAYRAAPDLTFWAAGSRSITMPSYSQVDIEFRVQQIPMPWYFQAQGLADPPAGAGKWVAIVAGGDVKPGEYYSLEAGNRGMLGSWLQWDLSGFYTWARDQVSLTPLDETFETVIPSRVTPGDSVVPLVNANLLEYEMFGGEALVRTLPTDWLRLELSYSLFYKYNYRGLPIPGDPQGRRLENKDMGNTPLETPRHVGRVRALVDLPWDADLTVLGILNSPHTLGSKFNYVAQRPDPLDGVVPDEVKARFQLDVVLQRSFWRDRLTASLWGRNLLAGDPYTDYYNQYVWSSYPHQIHRTFGGGLDYRF